MMRRPPTGSVTARRQPAAAAAAFLAVAMNSASAAIPGADPLGTEAALAATRTGLSEPPAAGCSLPARPLTLADAVELALCRNPRTRSTWAAARQQAAALGAAEGAWLPSLTATGSESWTDASRTSGSAGGSQRSRDAALNLSYTLFDFGARSARIAGARSLLAAAAASADSVAQQLVLDAVTAYYGVVASEAAFEAAAGAEAAAAHSLAVARGRRDAGAATRADVLQAETAFGQAVLNRVQAAGARKVARGTLAVILGATADRVLELAADPVPTEVPDLGTRVADLMAEAVRQRPDLAAAAAARDAAVADVTAARAAGRPSISIGASRNFVDTSGAPGQNYNSLGVAITVPLFSGFNTTYRVRAAEAALAAREATAEQIRLQVSLDVWSAYAGLESAAEQLKATATLLTSATENEDVARGRYQAGVGTIVDVLTAQSAGAAARQQRVAAERGWHQARAELALSLGRLTGAEPLAHSGGVP